MAFLGRPKDPYKALQKALQAGDNVKAIPCFEAILEQEPDNQQTRLRYADCLAAADHKPKAAKQYMDLATRMATSGFLIKAIAVYKKLVALDPSRQDFHRELAEMNKAREEGRDYLTPEKRAEAAKAAPAEEVKSIPLAPADEAKVAEKAEAPAEEVAAPSEAPAEAEGIPVAPPDEARLAEKEEAAAEEAPAEMEGIPLAPPDGARVVEKEEAPAEEPAEAEEAASERHAVDMDAGPAEIVEKAPAEEEPAAEEPAEVGLQFDLETGGVATEEVPAEEEAGPAEAAGEEVTFAEGPMAEEVAGSIEDEVGAAFDSLGEAGPAPETGTKAPPEHKAPIVLETEKIPLFSDLNTDEFTEIVLALRHFYYPEGHVIVQEGDPGNSMFILVMGEVSVTTTDPFDNAIDLATLGEGEFFGEVALITGKPRTATITTTQESEVMELAREDFEQIAERHPGIRQTVENFWKERTDRTVEAMVASMEKMEEEQEED